MNNDENKNIEGQENLLSKSYEDLLRRYDDQNKNEIKNLVDISSKEKDTVESTRNDRAKNFVLNIDENSIDYDEETPFSNKGEVYFANRPSTNHTSFNQESQNPKDKPNKCINWSRFNFLKSEKIQSSKTYRQFKFVAPLLAILFAVAIIFSSVILSCLNDIFSFTKNDKVVTVNIPTDASTKEIIKILDKNGLITHRGFCNFFIKTSKVFKYKFSDDENRLEIIKQIYNGTLDSNYLSGTYDLQRKMGVEGMLNSMKEARQGDQTVKITFPEGWTVERFIKKLVDNDVCSEELLRKSLQENDYKYDFMDELDSLSPNRYQRLEGYLYPSTYEFFVGESVSSVIDRLLEKFDEVWTDEYQKRADELGYTRDEIIIIASILEKEAADYEQMTLIASVLYNRLNNTVQYPSIQCDSTSDYIKNTVIPEIGKSAAQPYLEKYDTFTVTGLPAGPICNPGNSAIKAALYPAETKYYYFQHDNYRKIYMAETVSQHRENSLAVAKANRSGENFE